MNRFLLLLVLGVLWCAAGLCRTATSLVHDGDRWICLGDSITAMNCYPRVLERMLKHYHPEANVTVINSGVGGDTASDDPQKLTNRVLKYKPTIVSIMYGMNEAITVWHPGLPKAPIKENYRKSLTFMVRTLRAQGITVLLMSPTLTDPTCHSFFPLDNSLPSLKEYAGIMREVAKAEGAHYVPVQEAFEAFSKAQPDGVMMSADGVHPAALGQYDMARTLSEYCGFSYPLGKGTVRHGCQAPAAVPVTAALTSRFVQPNANQIDLTLTAVKPLTVTATWSVGDLRKQETLTLAAGANPWHIMVPNDHLPARNGQATDLLIDLRVGTADNLYIIDLCRTQVLHFLDNRVTGTVDGDDGTHIATWQVQRLGDSLLFSADVNDAEINSDGFWPFGVDGLNLMFDFRPTERFADLGIDREVYQTFLTVREKPVFAVGLRAWTGKGMGFASMVGGTRTPTGYSVQLLINGNFDGHTPVKLSSRDFVGLLVAVDDLAVVNKTSKVTITANQRNDVPVNVCANNLPILDLKNKLSGDQIINAHLDSAR